MVSCSTSFPSSFSLRTMGLSASLANMPAKSGTRASKMPDRLSGLMTGRPSRLHTWKSSSPKAGAWCTIPVPLSVVT